MYSLNNFIKFTARVNFCSETFLWNNLINILIQVHKLKSSFELIPKFMWHAMIVLKIYMCERMNEWIWSVGREIPKEKRRITPRLTCKKTNQSIANSTCLAWDWSQFFTMIDRWIRTKTMAWESRALGLSSMLKSPNKFP